MITKETIPFGKYAKFVAGACEWAKHNLQLVGLIAIYTFVRSLYWNIPPIWDAKVYYNGLIAANEDNFDILKYTVDGHISQGFFLVASLPYAVFARDYFRFNVWISCFGITSILIFYKVLDHLVKTKLNKWEIVLFTGCFAFHPSVLASMIHFSPDIGVLTFFLLLFLALLKNRAKLIVVASILFLFSKETAILLLPIPFAFSLALVPKQDRARRLKEYATWLLCAYLVLTLFLIYKTFIRGQIPVWVHLNTLGIRQGSSFLDGSLYDYIFMIFMLNFNWVLTFISIVGTTVYLVASGSKFDWRALGLGLCLVLCSIILMVVRPFNNVRYLLICEPLLIAFVVTLLPRYFFLAWKRIIFGGLLLGTLIIANFLTIDPISRAYFGTFAFGEHTLLRMTSSDDDRFWARDQLVYNLQFLEIPPIVNRILADIRPNESTLVLCHPVAAWELIDKVDSTTYQMTFGKKDSFSVRYVTPEAEFYSFDSDAWFINFPFCNNVMRIELLNRRYGDGELKSFERHGYRIDVYYYHGQKAR